MGASNENKINSKRQTVALSAGAIHKPDKLLAKLESGSKLDFRLIGCLWSMAGLLFFLAYIPPRQDPTNYANSVGVFLADLVFFGAGILCVAIPFLLMRECKQYFLKQLLELPFERLKIELQAHPNWLAYFPNRTEEMVLIAFTADPDVIKYIKSATTSFWKRAVKAHPKVVCKLSSDGHASNESVCELWQMALKQDPSLLKFAPKRFGHLELEIYSMLVERDPALIHRVPTIPMQERIRRELGLVE